MRPHITEKQGRRSGCIDVGPCLVIGQRSEMEGKIYIREELKKELERLQCEGKKIVFTNGCFDILHVGHTRYLKEAKKTGDVLAPALNSDASVRAIKGEKRPLLSENERADVVASLESVDYLTIFSENTPLEFVECFK